MKRALSHHEDESRRPLAEGLDAYERIMRAFEDEARAVCLRTRRKNSPWPRWLCELVEEKICPTLQLIGFEPWVCKLIFEAAAPTWALIGPMGEKTAAIFPGVQHQIDEIRLGVVSSDSGEQFPSHFNISWIVLPRAYRFLKKFHSRYILFYIRVLEHEDAAEFMKIMIRVVTEFLANFALKYVKDVQEKDKWAALVFHAYISMFWKNLRCPPEGLEDLLVFENFYILAKKIKEKFLPESPTLQRKVEAMERERKELFLFERPLFSRETSCSAPWKFLISLRHGGAGIETCLRLFGPGPTLLGDKTGGGVPYSRVPSFLNGLLKELRQRWGSFDRRFKRSVKIFLIALTQRYEHRVVRYSAGEASSNTQIRYTCARVQMLIRDFRSSLGF